MTGQDIYFVASILVLTLLLLVPVSRIILVLSVRRLQRKRSGELGQEEIGGQRGRARLLAAIVCLVFSYLFNAQLFGGVYG